MLLFVFERYFGFWGGRGKGGEKNIISGIDRARSAPQGIGSGRLGIDTCGNRTRVYLNFVLLFVFERYFGLLWGSKGG